MLTAGSLLWHYKPSLISKSIKRNRFVQLHGWTDERTDGRTNGRADGRADGRTDALTDERTDGQTDRCTD